MMDSSGVRQVSSVPGREAPGVASGMATAAPALRGAAVARSTRRRLRLGAVTANVVLLVLGVIFAIPML